MLAAEAGVQMFRTHDVAETVPALRMAEAILAQKKNELAGNRFFEHDWWRLSLEILLLAVGIYYALMFVRGTRGWSVVLGFLLLMAVTLVTLGAAPAGGDAGCWSVSLRFRRSPFW